MNDAGQAAEGPDVAREPSETPSASHSPSRRAWLARCARTLSALTAVGTFGVWSIPATAEAQIDLLGMLPALANGQIPGRYLRAGLAGQPTGRAYGVVDAPFADVMRVLARFSSYPRLVPTLGTLRVESRAPGLARIHATGRAPLLGAYEVPLEASIVGRSDGTHRIELRTPDGVRPRLHIGVSLRETPSRRRTVIAVELSLGVGRVPHGIARRAHVNASIATVAAIRRRVRSLRESGAVPRPAYACPA